MEDPLINDLVVRLRSEVVRLRAIEEHRAASQQGASPVSPVLPNEIVPALQAAGRNGNASSTCKKIKRVGNIPRDCSRFVRRHVRQWLNPSANGHAHANAPSTWKKIKRIGNIPRDCSRFVRRHARQWFGSIASWTTHQSLASFASLRELQEELRRLEQAHGASFGLQEAKHSEIVSRCRDLANECSSLRGQLLEQAAVSQNSKRDVASLQTRLLEQANRCQDLQSQMAVLRDQLLKQEACTSQVTEEFRQRVLKPAAAAEEFKRRMDPMYVAFEDRFRGTYENIKERVKVYVPFLRDSSVSARDKHC